LICTDFLKDFIRAPATAARQLEGGNTNSYVWVMEQTPHSMFWEKSGDACDHFNLLRFSIRLFITIHKQPEGQEVSFRWIVDMAITPAKTVDAGNPRSKTGAVRGSRDWLLPQFKPAEFEPV
jgi:hypothetical protein